MESSITGLFASWKINLRLASLIILLQLCRSLGNGRMTYLPFLSIIYIYIVHLYLSIVSATHLTMIYVLPCRVLVLRKTRFGSRICKHCYVAKIVLVFLRLLESCLQNSVRGQLMSRIVTWILSRTTQKGKAHTRKENHQRSRTYIWFFYLLGPKLDIWNFLSLLNLHHNIMREFEWQNWSLTIETSLAFLPYKKN